MYNCCSCCRVNFFLFRSKRNIHWTDTKVDLNTEEHVASEIIIADSSATVDDVFDPSLRVCEGDGVNVVLFLLSTYTDMRKLRRRNYWIEFFCCKMDNNSILFVLVELSHCWRLYRELLNIYRKDILITKNIFCGWPYD